MVVCAPQAGLCHLQLGSSCQLAGRGIGKQIKKMRF